MLCVRSSSKNFILLDALSVAESRVIKSLDMKSKTNLWRALVLLSFLGAHQACAESSKNLTAGLSTQVYLLGQYDPARLPEYFSEIPKSLADRKIYLRKEALLDLEQMSREAQKEKLQIKVISGFRGFDDQKRIWENKYNNTYAKTHPDPKERVVAILSYSSMPGTSRHHWGTDVDLNSLENSWFEKGEGKRLYDWLQKNGPRFGFYQVYTAGRKVGYHEERWHYSYLPLSKNLLAAYKDAISLPRLTGFAGEGFAKELSIIPNYVFGINEAVK